MKHSVYIGNYLIMSNCIFNNEIFSAENVRSMSQNQRHKGFTFVVCV